MVYGIGAERRDRRRRHRRLFAANALLAHGIAVSLYEQAPALGEVGAGVYVTPNAVRQLGAWASGLP